MHCRRLVIHIVAILVCMGLFFCSCEVAEKDVVVDDLKPSPGSTVYGKVLCAGRPLQGVPVSDGVTFTCTDEEGVYNLTTAKVNGYVFISVPSGYALPYTGTTMPAFWKTLTKEASVPERADFNLIKENQSLLTMILMGDIHLYSNRTKDVFTSTFVKEMNAYVPSQSTGPVYGLTLGDMTWDWYWYNGDRIGIDEYVSSVNSIAGMHIFNTVGNHDNDMRYDSLSEFIQTGEDRACMQTYRKKQGPTCYSFNMGGVHFISIDDVITTNTGGTSDKDSRDCMRGITQRDMAWLEEDLSFVSEDTPVVVSLHMPLFSMKGRPTNGNSSSVNYKAQDIVAPFRKFGKVLFISAHTHLLYNTEDYDFDGLKVTEWNSGALCGNFWTTAYKTGLNLCTDGTPGGYRIMTVDNGAISSIYKGIGKKTNYLFRSYDRNQMKLDASKLGNYTDGQIAGESNDNYIYINVWDYKPSWTISVQEYVTNSATTLQVERLTQSYDPLYMLMYEQKLTDTTPQPTVTMFRAKASSATSLVTIRVEDEFGNSRVEKMNRPKQFTIETYMNEQAE